MSIDLDAPINPDEVDTRGTDFDVLRPGKYPAQLIEAVEEKVSSGGTQHVLTWEIIEGPHEKRRVWDRVNYKNGNDEARRLASVHYAKLALAIGVPALASLRQAEFKPVLIDVTIDKGNGEYKDKNVVRVGGISPYGPTPAARPAQTTGATQAARTTQTARPAATQQRRAPVSDDVNPWDRGD